jgi:hypothetical protein
MGRPVFLASGGAGSIVVSLTSFTSNIVGFVEGSTPGEINGGTWRFIPQWAVTGV